jgi:hypothetical protein
VAALLLGGSYILVHYGSEARGYSLALCFGFLSLGIALADGPRPWSPRAPLAWVTLILAMLAPALALAVHFLVALIAWSGVRSLRRGGLRDAAVTLAWWYAVLAAFLFFYYMSFLRVMGSAGGPIMGIPAAMGSAIAGATGLPLLLPNSLLLLFAIAVTGISLMWLAARGSDLWVLFLLGRAFRAVAAGLLIAGIAAHLVIVGHLIDRQTTEIGEGADAFRADDRAGPVSELLSEIRRRAGAGQTLVAIPEGVMLLPLPPRQPRTVHPLRSGVPGAVRGEPDDARLRIEASGSGRIRQAQRESRGRVRARPRSGARGVDLGELPAGLAKHPLRSRVVRADSRALGARASRLLLLLPGGTVAQDVRKPLLALRVAL